jgi:hypothetical protein
MGGHGCCCSCRHSMVDVNSLMLCLCMLLAFVYISLHIHVHGVQGRHVNVMRKLCFKADYSQALLSSRFLFCDVVCSGGCGWLWCSAQQWLLHGVTASMCSVNG